MSLYEKEVFRRIQAPRTRAQQNTVRRAFWKVVPGGKAQTVRSDQAEKLVDEQQTDTEQHSAS